MITIIKGKVEDLRQDSQTRRRYNSPNTVMIGRTTGSYTVHRSKFRLDGVPVSLSGSRSQMIEEGDGLAVAGFKLFDQLNGVSFKTLASGHIEPSPGTFMGSLGLGAALVTASFFVRPEIITQVAPDFADEFFAPFWTFVRWAMLRFFGGFILFDALKLLLFSWMLRDA